MIMLWITLTSILWPMCPKRAERPMSGGNHGGVCHGPATPINRIPSPCGMGCGARAIAPVRRPRGGHPRGVPEQVEPPALLEEPAGGVDELGRAAAPRARAATKGEARGGTRGGGPVLDAEGHLGADAVQVPLRRGHVQGN